MQDPTHSKTDAALVKSEEDSNLFQAVTTFLAAPASYGPSVEKVEIIRTHGAIIFLAGDEAFKIKRPVKFPYLDFSSLNKREAVCKRELALNHPAAPDIYLGLTKITKQPDGSLAFNGKGEVIEWAVHMRRFPSENIFDDIARRGEFTKELAANLASMIAAYHSNQPPIIADDGAARIKEVIDQINDVFSCLIPHLPAELPEQYIAKAIGAYKAHQAALDKRAKDGMIRHCHGDLHLQNIVLLNDKPTLFDALEFDDRLAQIDCLYDLAFLLMDLNYRELRAAANTVLSSYTLEAWPLLDYEGFRLLPLFMSLRAAIRAMVAAEAAKQNPGMSKDKEAEAKTYLKKALRQFRPITPRLYAVGGLSGSGKSTLSASLCPELEGNVGAIRLRSDVTRKHIFGIDEFAPSPEWVYTPGNIQKVYDILFEKAVTILEQGQSVLLDAVFSRPHEREEVKELAAKNNIPFTGLWLEAPESCLKERVNNRTRDASDADAKVVDKQLNRIRHNNVTPESISNVDGWLKIDASGTAETTLKNAHAAIIRSKNS